MVESGVDVIFCDLPNVPPGAVGKFLLTQMVAIAELEAGLIGERTKAAPAPGRGRDCQGKVCSPETGAGDRELRTYGDGKP